MIFVWVIILFVIVIFLRALNSRVVKGVSPQELEHHFESFIDSAGDGALMFIKIPKTKLFLQFAIYRDTEHPVLHFAFPDAEWSRSLFPKVHQTLLDMGEQIEVTKTEMEKCSRFIEVNYALSVPDCPARMSNLARAVLVTLGSNDKKVNLKFDGDLLPKNEAIARFKARKGI